MHGQTRRYHENEIICRQGDHADNLLLLRDGAVGSYLNDDMPHPSEDAILKTGMRIDTTDKVGAVLSESGYFLKRHAVSLVALKRDTIIESIPIAEGGIEAAMKKRPQLGLALCRGLADRLRETSVAVTPLAARTEQIQREAERFALEFTRLVEEVRAEALKNKDLIPVADELETLPLYQSGHALSRERFSTCIFFTEIAARRETGVKSLAIGDVLIEENTPGRDIFLLREGELDVVREDTSIGRIKAGEMVGELSILRREHPFRTATVRAVKPSVAMAIRGVEFLEKAEKSPSILITLAKTLVRRMDATHMLYAQSLRACHAQLPFKLEDGSTYQSNFRTLINTLEKHEELELIHRNALESYNRFRYMLKEFCPEQGLGINYP